MSPPTQPSVESEQNATTTTTFPSLLPLTFLQEPLAVPPVVTPIHFVNTPLSLYAPYYALVIDGCLTEAECNVLLSAAEGHTSGEWEGAMINIGGGKQMMSKETRDCGRIIWDEEEVVKRIWGRVGPLVEKGIIDGAKEVKGKETCSLLDKGIGVLQGQSAQWAIGSGRVRRNEKWVCTGLNERMRFLRYEGGQYFRPHIDGPYVPLALLRSSRNPSIRSFFTLHLYLNGSSPSNPLRGGATTFWDYGPDGIGKRRLDVDPKAGRVLVFQHEELIHSGDDVLDGVKFTMRTDVMFERVEDDKV